MLRKYSLELRPKSTNRSEPSNTKPIRGSKMRCQLWLWLLISLLGCAGNDSQPIQPPSLSPVEAKTASDVGSREAADSGASPAASLPGTDAPSKPNANVLKVEKLQFNIPDGWQRKE